MTKHRQTATPVFDGYDNVLILTGPNGKDEVTAYLLTLPQKDQGKFKRYLERLRDGMHVKSPENMRHVQVPDPRGIGAEVHELKTHRDGGQRLYIVKFNGKWYLTHGTKKVKESAVPKEARKAFEIFHYNEDDEGD